MRVLGTFQSRDVADSVRDAFLKEGYAPEQLIVMANRESQTPPEDADLEPGTKGQGGMAELEERLGKAVSALLHKNVHMEGDGFEGEGRGGALLGVTVTDEGGAERAKELLERHHAGDIEIAQAD